MGCISTSARISRSEPTASQGLVYHPLWGLHTSPIRLSQSPAKTGDCLLKNERRLESAVAADGGSVPRFGSVPAGERHVGDAADGARAGARRRTSARPRRAATRRRRRTPRLRRAQGRGQHPSQRRLHHLPPALRRLLLPRLVRHGHRRRRLDLPHAPLQRIHRLLPRRLLLQNGLRRHPQRVLPRSRPSLLLSSFVTLSGSQALFQATNGSAN